LTFSITGSFAVVKLAIDIQTLERYACKLINVQSMLLAKQNNQTSIEGIEKEVFVLDSVNHENIVSIGGVFHDSVKHLVYIFLKRVDGGGKISLTLKIYLIIFLKTTG
jgi:serine/threonine-protein kinase Chk2